MRGSEESSEHKSVNLFIHKLIVHLIYTTINHFDANLLLFFYFPISVTLLFFCLLLFVISVRLIT